MQPDARSTLQSRTKLAACLPSCEALSGPLSAQLCKAMHAETLYSACAFTCRLRVWNPRGVLAMIIYTAALGFYIWIRTTKTLGLAQYTCALLCACSAC